MTNVIVVWGDESGGHEKKHSPSAILLIPSVDAGRLPVHIGGQVEGQLLNEWFFVGLLKHLIQIQ